MSIDTGKKLLDEKKYNEALAVFNAALNANPAQALEANYGIGLCLLNHKNYPEAIMALRRALESPGGATSSVLQEEIRSNLADCYLQTRDWDSVLSESEKLMKDYPSEAPVWQYKIAACRMSQENYRAAIEALKPAIEQATDPKYDGMRCDMMGRLAGCYWSVEDWENAATAYAKLAQGYEDQVVVSQYRIGICRMEQKKYSEAAAAFEIASSKSSDPTYKDLRRDILGRLAGCYWKANDYPDAVSTYEELANRYPDERLMSKYRIGLSEINQEHFREAAVALKEASALTADPRYPAIAKDLNSRLAQSLAKSDRTDDIAAAAGVYLKLRDQYPEDAAGWNHQLGICYMKIGKYQEASEALRVAVVSATEPVYKPSLKDMKARLGGCYKELGKWDEAEAMYDALLKEYPEDTEAWKYEIAVCQSVGKHNEEQAAAIYKEVTDKAFENVKTQTRDGIYRVFSALLTQKKYKDIVAYMDKVGKERPDLKPEALYWKGDVLICFVKDPYSAIAAFQELIAGYPKDARVRRARELLIGAKRSAGLLRFDEAVDSLKALAEECAPAERSRLLVKAGYLCYQATRYKQAAACYSRAANVKDAPAETTAEACFKLGLCYSQQTQARLAGTWMRRAASRFPSTRYGRQAQATLEGWDFAARYLAGQRAETGRASSMNQ